MENEGDSREKPAANERRGFGNGSDFTKFAHVMFRVSLPLTSLVNISVKYTLLKMLWEEAWEITRRQLGSNGVLIMTSKCTGGEQRTSQESPAVFVLNRYVHLCGIKWQFKEWENVSRKTS